MKQLLNILLTLLVFAWTDLISQPRNEDEEFIIHPEFNVRNSLMFIKEGIKSSGLFHQSKVTSDNVKYLHVVTKDYEIAYYYNDDEITTELRIFDRVRKLAKWQDFYNKQVDKWPKFWSKTSDYQFKFENKEANHLYYINLLRDLDNDVLIIEIK